MNTNHIIIEFFYIFLMQSLISCNLLGVIEGSSSETQRIRSAKETSQRPVPGTKKNCDCLYLSIQ